MYSPSGIMLLTELVKEFRIMYSFFNVCNSTMKCIAIMYYMDLILDVVGINGGQKCINANFCHLKPDFENSTPLILSKEYGSDVTSGPSAASCPRFILHVRLPPYNNPSRLYSC